MGSCISYVRNTMEKSLKTLSNDTTCEKTDIKTADATKDSTLETISAKLEPVVLKPIIFDDVLDEKSDTLLAKSDSGCVVMYDDRVPKSYEEWFRDQSASPNGVRVFEKELENDQPYDFYLSCLAMMQLNESYAKRHGYAFRFSREYRPYDLTHPPYWVKVKMVRDALHEIVRVNLATTTVNPASQSTQGSIFYAHEYVIWLDTDACVDKVSHETPLSKLFGQPGMGQDVCFLYSHNQKEWPDTLCAGVFVVRNTFKAREMFDEWLNMYDPSAWKIGASGEWECSGEWAGPKYEQGCAITLVSSPKYKEYVYQYPWYYFNNHNYKRSGRGFAMHFAGRYKLYIEPYLYRMFNQEHLSKTDSKTDSK